MACRSAVRRPRSGHPTLDAPATLWQRPAPRGISAPGLRQRAYEYCVRREMFALAMRISGGFGALDSCRRSVSAVFASPGGANCETQTTTAMAVGRHHGGGRDGDG